MTRDDDAELSIAERRARLVVDMTSAANAACRRWGIPRVSFELTFWETTSTVEVWRGEGKGVEQGGGKA